MRQTRKKQGKNKARKSRSENSPCERANAHQRKENATCLSAMASDGGFNCHYKIGPNNWAIVISAQREPWIWKNILSRADKFRLFVIAGSSLAPTVISCLLLSAPLQTMFFRCLLMLQKEFSGMLSRLNVRMTLP